MKNKKGIKKIIIILLIIIFIIIGYSFFFKKQDNNVLQQIIQTVIKKENITDNYNGVYVYKEELDKVYIAYSGCNVRTLDTYIVVTNKKYEIYNYTCMGTYYQKSGNTTELKFKYDSEKSLYKIDYDNKEFAKDLSIREVTPNNKISKALNKIDINSYKFILEQTEFTDNYYAIKAQIMGAEQYTLEIKPENSQNYMIHVYSKNDSGGYTYHASSLEQLPQFYTYYDHLIIIEPSTNNKGLANYKLKILNKNNEIDYNLENSFPIIINNKILNNENSIFIKKNNSSRYFDVLIGNDNDFCIEDSHSDEVAYYAFKVTYDTMNVSLNNPVYDTTIYKKDGCSHYNKIKEG